MYVQIKRGISTVLQTLLFQSNDYYNFIGRFHFDSSKTETEQQQQQRQQIGQSERAM